MTKASTKLKKARNQELENLMAFHLQVQGIYHRFVREYQHIPGRRFRLDFADPVNRVGIEVQGGIWGKRRSGHSTGAGIQRDCEKHNLALIHGWRVFKFTDHEIKDQSAAEMVADFYRCVLCVKSGEA